MFTNKPDYSRRLNQALANNAVWRTLAEKTTSVINDMVHDKRWQVSRIREPYVVQRGDWMDTPVGRGKVTLIRRSRSNIVNNTYDFEDNVEVAVPDAGVISLPVRVLQNRGTLIAGSKLMGFDYFSDALQDDDYGRIEQYIGKYWNSQGGVRFIDFLGYITRNRFEISSLWETEHGDPGAPANYRDPTTTEDSYLTLEPFSSFMNKVQDDPNLNLTSGVDFDDPSKYYQTSHVSLGWDVIDHPEVDFDGVISLFYYLAPIHLVMSRFVGTIYATENYYTGRNVQMSTIPQYSSMWDTTGVLNLLSGTTGGFSAIHQFSTQLSNPLPA